MGFFSKIAKVVKPVAKLATGDFGGAVSSASSLFLSNKGLSDQNEANIANAREAAVFNAQQAQLNRDFQADQARVAWDRNRHSARTAYTRNAYQAAMNRKWQKMMSDSAHQRQIADLRRAGLNPILSAKYGGASSPPGAMGSSPTAVATAPAGSTASRQAATSVDEWTPALASAYQAAKTRADVSLSQAKVQESISNTALNAAKRNVEVAKVPVEEARAAQMQEQTLTEKVHREYLSSQTGVNKERVAEIRATVKKLEAQHRLNTAQAQELEALLRVAELKGDMSDRWWSETLESLSRWSGPMALAVGGAFGMAKMAGALWRTLPKGVTHPVLDAMRKITGGMKPIDPSNPKRYRQW